MTACRVAVLSRLRDVSYESFHAQKDGSYTGRESVAA